MVIVSIYDAGSRSQDFGMISDAFIRIVNLDDNREIARYDLAEKFSGETCIIFGELERQKGNWSFKAVGEIVAGGLVPLLQSYGVNV